MHEWEPFRDVVAVLLIDPNSRQEKSFINRSCLIFHYNYFIITLLKNIPYRFQLKGFQQLKIKNAVLQSFCLILLKTMNRLMDTGENHVLSTC